MNVYKDLVLTSMNDFQVEYDPGTIPSDNLQKAIDLLASAWDKLAEGVKIVAQEFWSIVKYLGVAFYEALKKGLSAAYDFMVSALKSITSYLTDLAHSVGRAIMAGVSKLMALTKRFLVAVKDFAADHKTLILVLLAIIATVTITVYFLKRRAKAAAKTANASTVDMFLNEDIKEQKAYLDGLAIVDQIAEGAEETVEEQPKVDRNLAKKVAANLRKLGQVFKEAVNEMATAEEDSLLLAILRGIGKLCWYALVASAVTVGVVLTSYGLGKVLY